MTYGYPLTPKDEPIIIFRNDNPWQHRFAPGMDDGGRWLGVPPGSSARMQIRHYDGAPGPPILEAAMSVDMWNVIAVISRAQIATIPTLSEPGCPDTFRYDVLLTVPDVGENVAFYGNATVYPGVTG